MELKTAIEKRSSIREFKSYAVNMDDVKEIIRMAGLAPSINNYQPWKYYIITNREILSQMAEVVTREIAMMPENDSRMARLLKNQAAWSSTFFHDAPMLIALAGHPFETDLDMGVNISHEELERMRNYPDLQSAGASIQNLLLSATEKGYGTCWMTGPLYARESIQEILSINEPWRLISFVAMGKTLNTQKRSREKRNLAEEMVIID